MAGKSKRKTKENIKTGITGVEPKAEVKKAKDPIPNTMNILSQLGKVKLENKDLGNDLNVLLTGLTGITNVVSKIKTSPKDAANIQAFGDSGIIKLLLSISKIKNENVEIANDIDILTNALTMMLDRLDGIRISESQIESIKSISESGIFSIFDKISGVKVSYDSISSIMEGLEVIGMLNDVNWFDVQEGLNAVNVDYITTIFKKLNSINLDNLKGLENIPKVVETISKIKDIKFKISDVVRLYAFIHIARFVISEVKKIAESEPDDPKNIKTVNLSAATKLAKDLESIKVSPMLYVNLLQLKFAVFLVRKVIASIPQGDALKPVYMLGSSIQNLISVMVSISEAKISTKMLKNIMLIEKAMDRLMSILDKIATIKINPQSVKRADKALKPMIEVVKSVMDLMKALLLSAPMAILFIMMSPILVMLYMTMGLVLSLIMRSIALATKTNNPMALVQFNTLLLSIVLLTATLLLLALAGVMLMKTAMLIVGTLLLLVLIIAVIGLVLWGLSLLAPFVLPGLMVVGAVTLVVVALLLMVLALWAIGAIELNMEAITDNLYIVGEVFAQLASMVSIGAVVDAVILVPLIIGMTIGVLGILLIAAMLWMLQYINLDKEKILNNVQSVIDICESILQTLYGDSEDGEGDKGILGSIFDYLGSRVGKMIDALSAMVYFISMALAVAAILIIAGMLRLLAELDIEKIKKSKDITIATLQVCSDIINILMGDYETPEKGKNEDGSALEEVFKGKFPSLISSIIGMVKLFPIVLAIGMVMVIALMLRGLAEMEDKSEQAKTNVSNILGNVDSIVDAILNPGTKEAPKEESGGFLDALTGFITGIFGTLKYLALLPMLGALGIVIASIKMVESIGEMLNNLSTLDTSKFNNISTKVSDIMSTANIVVNAILQKMDIDDDDAEDILDVVKYLAPATEHLVKIANNLSKTSSIVVDKDKVMAHIQLIKDISDETKGISLSGLTNISDKVAKISKDLAKGVMGDLTNGIIDVSKADSKNIESITSNYIKFLDKVNSTDVEKLKTTSNMMKHWAELSRSLNGNFDGLARALNEHILPALDELNDTMENVKTTLESANTQRAEMYADKGGANADPAKIAAQPTSNAGENETSKRVREAQKRLKDARINTNSVADILLSGEAIVKVKH